MTLPPLAYARPASLEEAVALLDDDGARVLAGGQSLVPALASRIGPRPRTLVDITRLPGLDVIANDADGRLRIGALVRQRAAERSPLVARHAPMLRDALAEVGHPSTRHRGTVVGSLLQADPSAEVPAVSVALDGVAVVAGPAGTRRELPVAALLAGAQRTTLARGELVTELRLAVAADGEGQAWVEFAQRRYDLPLVGAAARVAPDGSARVTLAGVASTPVAAELGVRPAHGDAAMVARVVAALEPPSDARASAALRRHLAQTLALRALAQASEATDA